MKKALLTSVLLCAAAPMFGAARLTFNIKGEPVAIAWPAASFPIRYTVDGAAAQKLAGGAEAVGSAFGSWQSVQEAGVRFQDAGVGSAAAGKDGVNSVTVSDSLFASSGFIAFTTTWFDDQGRITESDIQVDSSVAGDQRKVGALVEHEVGHFLGLDHSAVVSSTMYPYVSSTGVSGLDSDDRIALTSVYPHPHSATITSTVRGRVLGTGGPLFGAQVVAVNSQGAPVASALTLQDGSFEFAVPADRYKVYVEPLDGPVEHSSLSGVWRDSSKGAFRTEFFQGSEWLELGPGETRENVEIRAALPTSLNPRWIGAFPAGSRDVKLASTPATIQAGQTMSIAVGGDGFVSGMTKFEVLSPGFSRVSEFQYGPNYVWATYQVARNTPDGSLVVLVNNGAESATLTGALKVEGSSPSTGRRRPVQTP
jgi:hypothetical protein